jgi:hypothetical protein
MTPAHDQYDSNGRTHTVMPAKAGINIFGPMSMDTGVRWNDRQSEFVIELLPTLFYPNIVDSWRCRLNRPGGSVFDSNQCKAAANG